MSAAFPRPHHGMASTLISALPDGRKIKECVPRMRACDEKNEKGKLCAGHLKRWNDAAPELKQQLGEELYRCERCHTLYVPNLSQPARTRTLWW